MVFGRLCEVDFCSTPCSSAGGAVCNSTVSGSAGTHVTFMPAHPSRAAPRPRVRCQAGRGGGDHLRHRVGHLHINYRARYTELNTSNRKCCLEKQMPSFPPLCCHTFSTSREELLSHAVLGFSCGGDARQARSDLYVGQVPHAVAECGHGGKAVRGSHDDRRRHPAVNRPPRPAIAVLTVPDK